MSIVVIQVYGVHTQLYTFDPRNTLMHAKEAQKTPKRRARGALERSRTAKCNFACTQAMRTTVIFFHDVSKIGKRTLATVHFKNSFSSG